MTTDNNHKHLWRLKDKSSQHNSLTIRPTVRNVYAQWSNSRRPLSPDIQCWQGDAWVGVAKFRPFAQPPSADPTTGQHWSFGGRGVCKNNYMRAMLKYSCCELLSFNSPWNSGLALIDHVLHKRCLTIYMNTARSINTKTEMKQMQTFFFWRRACQRKRSSNVLQPRAPARCCWVCAVPCVVER